MPYIHEGEANGLCFSTNNDSIPPSLRNIFREIEQDVYGGLYLNKDPLLARWAKQGVLLLNTILTVDENVSLSHAKIMGWEFITKAVIKSLVDEVPNIVYLLWGGKARSFMSNLEEDNNLFLYSGHPSPLSANNGNWFENKHFSLTNAYLQKNNKEPIIW